MGNYKIAIVGLGASARNIHIPAYRKIPNLQIIGGYDPSVTAGSGKFRFPLFSNLDELLKSGPDIVTVTTPTKFHHEITKLCLMHNIHVFCEKPFTSTLDEAKELVELSDRYKRWIVVNNEFRFMNIYQTAKNKIGSSEFGDLLFISANQTFYVNEISEAGWRGEDNQRTCKEFGIHVLDLCRFFFDEEPIYINAMMPKPGNPSGPDYLNLIELMFTGDRMAQITLDRLSRGRHRYLDLRLDGSVSSIETEFGGKVEFRAGIRGGDRKPYMDMDITPGSRAVQFNGENYRKIAGDPLDIFANATSKLVEQFIKSIDHSTIPDCNAGDNIKTLALMLAAYDSAISRKPVAFAENWKY